ncbi:hypothetical protein [Jannaschia sp. M317]|uniref:hypothetical protein n=1 Tax=Jannaschia sp. M317 TaxID=2867011 RepID=UPI0021A590CD|nr:hypothetical protein [Jannaschia sp. M317]UWQ18702.1 hypothetical protein K3551_05285 [Jannaschia sp. M317]
MIRTFLALTAALMLTGGAAAAQTVIVLFPPADFPAPDGPVVTRDTGGTPRQGG